MKTAAVILPCVVEQGNAIDGSTVLSNAFLLVI